MLALPGFLTIAVFLVRVLSRRVSVLVALTVIPILAALRGRRGAASSAS